MTISPANAPFVGLALGIAIYVSAYLSLRLLKWSRR